MLINLIGNAVKFTDSGRVDVSVRMEDSLSSPHPKVAFIVSDTGPGLRQTDRAFLCFIYRSLFADILVIVQSMLFQPFSQETRPPRACTADRVSVSPSASG